MQGVWFVLTVVNIFNSKSCFRTRPSILDVGVAMPDYSLSPPLPIVTPHKQRKQGKLIGVGVHTYAVYIYRCLWTQKN